MDLSWFKLSIFFLKNNISDLNLVNKQNFYRKILFISELILLESKLVDV